ncbi:MAG: DUF3987 domain-containing protein [Gammaproteobacteria bacterium]|nr:DUF3987 domain-containing protein [Gammaproteobacteria bacterium]
MTRLDYALRYGGLGWAVVPLYGLIAGKCACGGAECKSPGKHPHRDLVPHGVHDSSKDPARITDWFTRVPQANIGIATGAPSGFDALDVDPRNGGDDTLADAEHKHGKLPDTALQLTGGGGYHYLLSHDPGKRLRSPGRGIDIKSSGGYIVVEPSSHVSGGTYAWEGSADPTDGHPIAPAPAWLATPAPQIAASTTTAGVGYLPPQRIADLRSALAHLDASEYHVWISVGQALHSTEAPEAFEIWDTWSQGAVNYDGSTTAKCRTLNAGGPLHVQSIFVCERNAGWDDAAPMAATPAENIVPYRPAETTTPNHLLRIPGALGTFVDLCNRTAPKPQPQFAVQAALAFASIVMGRRYRTTMDNWTAMYFVNVGKSASGKEHARTVLYAALAEAGLGALIGPSGYTSDAAVFSSLHHQPAQLTIIDELGALLGNSKAQGNYHKRGALDSLTSLWGLFGSSLYPQGYSTMSLRPEQRAEMASRVVHRPSLTLLGMTTPKTFYESLTEAAIEGGFLNRLLIVESSIGRQLSRECDPLEVPDSLTEWCRAVREGQGGNLSGLDMPADSIPVPRVVDFTPEAKALFRAFEVECNDLMDALEGEALGEMYGRSREKALRIALMLAVSDNVALPFIRKEHAEWAIDYVRHYTGQTVEAIRTHMTGSLFGQWRAATVEAIRRAGDHGLTMRELCRNSRTFAGLDPRQRDQVLKALADEGLIARRDSKGPSGRGRTRSAYVASGDQEDEAA